MANLTKEDKIQKLFYNFDLNKDQTLQKREFVPALRTLLTELGEDFPEKKHEQVVNECIELFDLNGNGCIEYDEFYNLIEFLINEKGYELHS